ncbi:glycosyltransferase [Synechococcus sp. Cruz-9H2]|uniref:glycosyltransferase family 2 protein n=1 Tax=unclassified Synechococcus TaxID=2626047 RepID=UPI0020CF87E7|nr:MULTISPECIES: glycosyltransferase [unclassified Synechococcus]MCP9820732.1 glycosyltransferase [Synechococcus sp. Cruz-9H2]MCP9845012.1 glycosyltransferase [Synechococcus sp. Edmonson 11F2]MCP9857133.1 glycosyltransferase [Synechococcus sp. Cruz-9C9]MCP9864418.1 glycosyltransferase [Synechococcus sp. Cruz-7E5]MCP9871642.1 glycosyltransferase [Synechococcus sp. Cruz-7B9]
MTSDEAITIVVTPRERYSCALRSMQSLLATTPAHHPVVYLDAGTPPSLRQDLEELAHGRAVTFVAAEADLNPNQLRTIGFEHSATAYTCFVDNDILYRPGWLENLANAAQQAKATIVHPIYLIGEFQNDRIHHAGGRITINTSVTPSHFADEHLLANKSYSKNSDLLRRTTSDYAEFHCLLIQTETLQHLGPLDQKLASLNEHSDLCLQVRQAGGTIVVEPSSVVTYVPASKVSPFWLADARLFKRRWSTQDNLQSIQHFSEKWGFDFNEQNPPSALSYGNWAWRQMIDLRPHHPADQTISEIGSVSNIDYPYVHTFPRLARQCFELGFSADELTRIRTAFDLATSVHRGALRRCRLAFIDHCVGVASVLAVHGASTDLVIAGLLHALYLQGASSSDCILTATPKHRAFVKELVGAPIEAVVHWYPTCSFLEPDHWSQIPTAIEQTPLELAAALIVRVANEIEECLDHKLLFDHKVLLKTKGDAHRESGVDVTCNMESITSPVESPLTPSAGGQSRSYLFTHASPVLALAGYPSLCDEGLARIRQIEQPFPAHIPDQNPSSNSGTMPDWLIDLIGSPCTSLLPTSNRYAVLQQTSLSLKRRIPSRIRRTRVGQTAKHLVDRLISKF